MTTSTTTIKSEPLPDQNDYDANGEDIESAQLPSPPENETSISSPLGTASKRRTATKTSSNDNDTKKQLRVKRSRNKHGSSKGKIDFNYMMKYISLFLLIAQMVGLVLMLRVSRTQQGADLYLASTAVFLMEVMKFIICLSVVFMQCNYDLKKFLSELTVHVYHSPYEILKLSVPSFLYTVQNNLLYLALTNLDAATYQVCYQLKILTTALFSVIMLKRQFSSFKWLSLCVLTIGVAIVQSSGTNNAKTSADDSTNKNRLIGFIAVLCAACTSGFAGVYFERILKSSAKTSLWIRNIQMSLPSIVIAYLTIFVQDYATVRSKGFFIGYNYLVWMVIIIQAVGGLIVAVVVKYADNVLKGFATSFSIIISVFVSALFFHDDSFHPNFRFFLGTGLVLSSSYMYSYPEGGKKRKMAASSGSSSLRKSTVQHKSSLPLSSTHLSVSNSKSVLGARSSSVVL